MRKTSKAIIDEVVGLCNTLVHRHVLKADGKPSWFIKQVQRIDFEANTLQSALDEPEDEEDAELRDRLSRDGDGDNDARTIDAVLLDRHMRVARDTKKAFSYNRCEGTWYWYDLSEAGNTDEWVGPFPDFLACLTDAIAPYTGDSE